jgi:hypothetical protein
MCLSIRTLCSRTFTRNDGSVLGSTSIAVGSRPADPHHRRCRSTPAPRLIKTPGAERRSVNAAVFLQHQRLNKAKREKRKRHGPPKPTLPAIRRAVLNALLSASAPERCPHCRIRFRGPKYILQSSARHCCTKCIFMYSGPILIAVWSVESQVCEEYVEPGYASALCVSLQSPLRISAERNPCSIAHTFKARKATTSTESAFSILALRLAREEDFGMCPSPRSSA